MFKVVAGKCDLVKHVINVENAFPIKQFLCPVPLRVQGEVDKIIKEIKEQGVIKESQSLWVSPAITSLYLVEKKDRTIRFCVDRKQ